MNNYFITATGTDVGKTIVTAGFLRYLRNSGINAITMKPAQTGAEKIDGNWSAPDLQVHWKAANLAFSPEEQAIMAPYLYEPACSPHLAAHMAKRYPDIQHILDCASKLNEQYDCLLVEGAGGIYAPITETETMLDLMKAFGYPVILVAHRGLGTINHTLLSIEAIRSAGLTLHGIILNETENVEPDYIKQDNPSAIQSFGKTKILGNIDYITQLETEPDLAWQRFEDCFPTLPRLFD
ncbi:MAG: dethiobiotin synthase [Candidatus Hydrogenedentota bacterium]